MILLKVKTETKCIAKSTRKWYQRFGLNISKSIDNHLEFHVSKPYIQPVIHNFAMMIHLMPKENPYHI